VNNLSGEKPVKYVLSVLVALTLTLTLASASAQKKDPFAPTPPLPSDSNGSATPSASSAIPDDSFDIPRAAPQRPKAEKPQPPEESCEYLIAIKEVERLKGELRDETNKFAFTLVLSSLMAACIFGLIYFNRPSKPSFLKDFVPKAPTLMVTCSYCKRQTRAVAKHCVHCQSPLRITKAEDETEEKKE
jgi:hypothetical protein